MLSKELMRYLIGNQTEGYEVKEKSSVKEIYTAGLSFLARCSEVGLYCR